MTTTENPSTTVGPGPAPALPEDPDEFRAHVQAWLDNNATPISADDLWTISGWVTEEEAPAYFAAGLAWQRKIYEAGFAAIAWPAEYGGGGGHGWQTRIFNEESAKYEENAGFINSTMAMLGPTVLKHATEEQKRRFIPPLLSGELAFCQLFSEPGSGSDLASLATRAERDGDQFVINGQKVWNSSAQFCNWGFLLARTDPDLPKHQGITFFLLDMTSPGVEVRPLVMANGSAHFNEVFLTDVRVPADQVIGEVNGGWGPARTVLGNESAFIGRPSAPTSEKLHELARIHGRTDDPHVRQELVALRSRELLQGLMGEQIQAAVRRGEAPPIDGALIKLYAAESKRRSGDLAMQITGMAGTVDTDKPSRFAQAELINRYSISIGGGTNEVQRNNLAERALGLPREPRVDKDLAWKDVPRS